MSIIARIHVMRYGGDVDRFHTERIIGRQSVAHHSFGVACIIDALVAQPSAALLKAALFHDLPEYCTGDVPAPAKWAHPHLEEALKKVEDSWHDRHDNRFRMELTVNERATLKWADSLELMMFCLEQRRMGNRYVDNIFNKVVDLLKERTYDGCAGNAILLFKEVVREYGK